MTPAHRADIVATLITSLNAAYARFRCRNPRFKASSQACGLKRKSHTRPLCRAAACLRPVHMVALGRAGGPWAWVQGSLRSAAAAADAADGRILALPPSPFPQGSVSLLAHSLGTVLCYDILCAQPLSPQLVESAGLLPHDAAPGPAPGQPSPAASPRAAAAAVLGGGEASPGGEAAAPGSPSAALLQELSRLRADNQRLALQLEVSRAEGGAHHAATSTAAVSALSPGKQQHGLYTGQDGSPPLWPALDFR
jgi:hypothetical protein